MTNSNTTAIVLSLISGLSTGFGGLIVFLFDTPNEKTIGWMFGLASGVMLYVSFIDLLPEAIEKIGYIHTPFYFLIGMLIFYFIITFIPEPDTSLIAKENKVDKKLLMTSLVVFTGICLHNFPEGMAVYLSTLRGWSLGLTIALAIGMHNIPEGVVVACSIYASTKSKWSAIKWTLISGLFEPLGAFAFGLFFYKYLTENAVYSMLSGVAGIMVFICIHELIPSCLKYLSFVKTILANLVGIGIIYACSILIHQYE